MTMYAPFTKTITRRPDSANVHPTDPSTMGDSVQFVAKISIMCLP